VWRELDGPADIHIRSVSIRSLSSRKVAKLIKTYRASTHENITSHRRNATHDKSEIFARNNPIVFFPLIVGLYVSLSSSV
jgi:hypothetical protein